MFEQEISSML